eukprot:TRINITY_DN40595_c0_g1_i1.p1 TRINITY_DN40595_c0_g1~~TRINITY_DN40595_c0_g1_i1.p1  ORF type:complete len:450 (+),score=73.91 TRINITY_DN40595_c0_g1_i1:52-1401(+)
MAVGVRLAAARPRPYVRCHVVARRFVSAIAAGLAVSMAPKAAAVASNARLFNVLERVSLWRPHLDKDSLAVLNAVETDGDCAREVDVVATSTLSLVSCGLPTLLSLEVLCIAWEHLASCASDTSVRDDFASAAATAALRSSGDSLSADGGRGLCSRDAVLAEVDLVHRLFQERLASVLRAWKPPDEAAAALRQCVDDETRRISSTLTALLGASDQPSSVFGHLLWAGHRLGLGRRVLQWRANQLMAVVEFGLASFLPRIQLDSEFADSRMQVLLSLLRAQQGREQRFVEVGVHLARLSFAMMSELPDVQYIGVDPFSYEASTSAVSVTAQLRDLDLENIEGLREVREGAEHKFALFGERAQLWPVTSVEGARRLPDASVDGVFIDGDHSFAAVAADVEAWEPKVRPGGFLSGHDFGHNLEVAAAVLAYAARRNRTVHLSMDWVWYWHIP